MTNPKLTITIKVLVENCKEELASSATPNLFLGLQSLVGSSSFDPSEVETGLNFVVLGSSSTSVGFVSCVIVSKSTFSSSSSWFISIVVVGVGNIDVCMGDGLLDGTIFEEGNAGLLD